jgi:ATP-dependent Clp protease ATP-binding subunit ClpA
MVTASAATIEQLARDVVMSVDAEHALRAVTALRGELNLYEPELVLRALRTGASWSQVARALGVTKQAAHKKHRHLAEQTPPTAAAAGPKILVTAEARRSIQLAREEARALGQAAVGTEHILLGILRCSESHAVRALNALGVTLDSARACLQPTLVSVPPPSSSAPSAGRGGGITPHARRILEGSLREAVKRQEGYIGVEHLLLALLADSRNGATQTLEALRTTPGQIRRQLEHEWEAVAAAAPEHPVSVAGDPDAPGDPLLAAGPAA